MQIGVSSPPARIRDATSRPSRSGSTTSSTITAGGSATTAASAASPVAAVRTAKPSRRSARSRATRIAGSSSTTRISGCAGIRPPACPPACRPAPVSPAVRDERVQPLLDQCLDGRGDLLRLDAQRLGDGRVPRFALLALLRAPLTAGRAAFGAATTSPAGLSSSWPSLVASTCRNCPAGFLSFCLAAVAPRRGARHRQWRVLRRSSIETCHEHEHGSCGNAVVVLDVPLCDDARLALEAELADRRGVEREARSRPPAATRSSVRR